MNSTTSQGDRRTLSSMTGYGSAQTDHELGRLSVELRTVNARFLDIAFRLPDELRMLEPIFRDAIAARLSRGKVECRAGVQSRSVQRPELRIRPGMLDALGSAQAQVLASLPQAQPLSVGDLLRFPGFIEDQQPDAAQWVAAFAPVIDRALDALLAHRSREGARLGQMIAQHAHSMQGIVRVQRERAPQLVEAFGQRLTERLREAATGGLSGTGIPLEESMARIRQEVALHGLRVDVAEELSRLDIHLDELLRIVERGGQAGKRLDFLMQELNREANTLGSKSSGLEATAASIELKLLIEQVREQVQNLE